MSNSCTFPPALGLNTSSACSTTVPILSVRRASFSTNCSEILGQSEIDQTQQLFPVPDKLQPQTPSLQTQPQQLFAPYNFLSFPFFSHSSPFSTFSQFMQSNTANGKNIGMNTQNVFSTANKSESAFEAENKYEPIASEMNLRAMQELLNKLVQQQQLQQSPLNPTTAAATQEAVNIDLYGLYAYQYLQRLQQLQTYYNLQNLQQSLHSSAYNNVGNVHSENFSTPTQSNQVKESPENSVPSHTETAAATTTTTTAAAKIQMRKRKADLLMCDITLNKLENAELKTKQLRLQRRKEKKSCRERQRRVAIANLFAKLNSLVCQQNSAHIHNTNNKSNKYVKYEASSKLSEEEMELEVEGRNRGSILSDLLKHFSKKFNKTVPTVPNLLNSSILLANIDDESKSQKSSSSLDTPKVMKAEEEVKDKEAISLLSDKNRREKKSQREKQRRTEVNVLAMRLGLLLEVKEFKDKLIVLQTAKQLF